MERAGSVDLLFLNMILLKNSEVFMNKEWAEMNKTFQLQIKKKEDGCIRRWRHRRKCDRGDHRKIRTRSGTAGLLKSSNRYLLLCMKFIL